MIVRLWKGKKQMTLTGKKNQLLHAVSALSSFDAASEMRYPSTTWSLNIKTFYY